MFLLNYFRRLPYYVQSQIITVIIIAVIGAWAKFNWTVALMLLAGIFVIALLVGLYLFLVRLYHDRQATAFTGEMGTLNSGTPRGINDPAKQARLDDLKKNFSNGLAKFRSIGKDFYQLPWYVIVGEPGAGKTEAVRHSGVGFPPGMQDELQGVGGTINMNWWFTNQAVILDTAGRLMFEEVEPGSTNEWKEFLSLLKKYRPNCPVNGLFLALPADSLIREASAEIERKAGRIARQLEVIEKQFDVRFPVFVIITKCDLLNGFRDFFESIDDPNAQNQMIGWSNPDPLDAPFRPELIDQHIETALGRLRRRRLALIQDPAALAGPQARRMDEVDRLYALPQSLALMAPRLRRYLEIIFTQNEWSAKPLFLRGIYFTSSLREGSALDQELAEAIGVPVDNLPEGRAWEREGTYFLRDVFVEKAFREKGLVTSASDTKKLLRKRQALVFGAGFLAVALLALFSFLGQQQLQNSVARQGGYWMRAAEGWNPKDDHWEPLIASDGSGKAAFDGEQPIGPGERSDTHLLFKNGTEDHTQFHTDLRDLTALPISVSWVFRPLTGFGIGLDGDRRRAQRVVFEGSVVKPLLDASRDLMINNTPPATAEAENAALLALVRLEAASMKHVAVNTDGGEGWNARFFTPLLNYTAGKPPGDDPRTLATVAAYTYSRDGSGDSWAPDWLNGGDNLSTNKPIAAGIERLATRAHNAVRDEAARLALLAELADLAKQFRDKESDLFAAVTAHQPVEKTDAQVLAITGVRAELAAPTGTLKDCKLQLDHKLADFAAMPGFFDKGMGLRAAYERSAAELKGDIDQIKALLAECEPFAPNTKLADGVRAGLRGQQAMIASAAVSAADTSGRHPLFASMAERLTPLLPELQAAYEQAAPNDATLALWKELDTDFLDDYGDGRRLYAWRWDAYESADTIAPGRGYAANQQLVGAEWKPLQAIFQKVADLRAQMQAYKKGLREKLIAITNYNYMRVERFHSEQFPIAYLAQVRAKVKETLHYPLVYPPGSDNEALNPVQLRDAGLLARQIDADLKSPVITPIHNPGRDQLNAFAAKLQSWEMVATALTTADGKPSEVNVSLVSGATQRQMGAPPTTFTIWPAIEMRDGDYRHGSRPSGAQVQGRTRTDAAGDVQLGRFPADAAFHFHAFHTMNEPHVEVPCGDNYSAVRLINGIYGSAQPDGQTWLASVRLSGTEAVWVRLQFARPLPAVRDWPTKYGLELED